MVAATVDLGAAEITQRQELAAAVAQAAMPEQGVMVVASMPLQLTQTAQPARVVGAAVVAVAVLLTLLALAAV
jgi:hypothetical protein